MNHLLERKIGTLKVFNIPFVGLKKVVHQFEYALDSSFFQEFENSPIEESALEVFLDFNKKHNFFELDFHIEGKVKSQCDRCSDEFFLKIDLDDQAIIKLANLEKISKESDLDILTIPLDSSAVNIAHLIYEIIVLSLPIRKNCDENGIGDKKCNPTILEILNKEQNQKEETTDPRWEALLKFKKDNN
ncbi:MAG: DUF177 domain-containing protein [Chitinophagales bacterium]